MNRRTVLQSVLAFVGLSRFVRADPVVEEGIVLCSIPDQEVVIRDVCRAILDEIEKPAGHWFVSVSGVMGQPNCSWVFLDHEVDPRNCRECYVGRFSVDRFAWQKLSACERMTSLRKAIQATTMEMRLLKPGWPGLLTKDEEIVSSGHIG